MRPARAARGVAAAARSPPGPFRDAHYVIKVEAFAADAEAGPTEADPDEDHLEAAGQMPRDPDEGEAADVPAARQQMRVDLCRACHRRFPRDPLGQQHRPPALFIKD